MKAQPFAKTPAHIEPLEQRIAPAALMDFKPVTAAGSILLDADPTTNAPAGLTIGLDGPFLVHVSKGMARVFFQDYNNNGQVDFNELTGIAAGDGLRITLFVDVHGDIVTNLNPDGTLTDSDGVASNGRDGQILLNSRIEKIELRSVTTNDLEEGDFVEDRIALSSYSIFGNIFAGAGFGATDGGLLIDTSGFPTQQLVFDGTTGSTLFVAVVPQIGSISVGTAATNQSFSFGISGDDPTTVQIEGDDIRGRIRPFVPAANAPGADIINVRAADPSMKFNIGSLRAGDGGFNGRGGDIINPIISGDAGGGYALIAGNAGSGPTGQRGGNISGWIDYGSLAGAVFVKTGDGGKGELGRGGNGGNLSFGDFDTGLVSSAVNILGHVEITLGRGGDGLTGGGDGGSQPNGIFITPEGDIPFGSELVSSWHQPGDIGQLVSDVPAGTLGYHSVRGFDFNHDGINDTIYASTQQIGQIGSGQLTVLFGTGGGFWDVNDRLYLNGPSNVGALTVGDFDNDGNPDIAVASASASFSGITVFLSLYDPVSGAFKGFSDGLYSPLPTFARNVTGGYRTLSATTGLPISDTTYFSGLTRQQTAYTVDAMVSGDFDGDGAVDLAIHTNQGTMWLRGDIDPGPNGTAAAPSGYFYSDFLRNNGKIPLESSNLMNGSFPVLKATALADGGLDKFLGASEQAQDSGFFGMFGVSATGIFTLTRFSMGQVDTDRQLSTPQANHINLADAKVRDLTVLDWDSDGDSDIVALTEAPGAYLITFDGNGAGGFTRASDGPAGENSGIRIGGRSTSPNFGQDMNENLYGIMAVYSSGGTLNATGAALELAIMDYQNDLIGVNGVHVTVLEFVGGTFNTVDRVGSAVTPDPFPFVGGDQNIRAFDVYTPNPAIPTAQTVAHLFPLKNDDRYDLVESFSFPSTGGAYIGIEDNGWFFSAGDGGSSLQGPGGKGGVIGKTLTLDPATGAPVGSFSITLPIQPAYEGTVRLLGGDGGNGFTAGGAGGNVSGASVFYANGATVFSSEVLVLAGDGGTSARGQGGRGGSLSALRIETGEIFKAGDGGAGRKGGDGGAVIGNPFGIDASVAQVPSVNSSPKDDFENSLDAFVVVVGGKGGSGLISGGNGGSISGFTPRFIPIIGGSGGLLYYEAGAGGDSLRGVGGKGGSVVESSPVENGNNLAGTIYVRAGDGGDGKTGGAGGSIRDFVNKPTADILPASTTFLAGNGGTGIAGRGGAGGDIAAVSADGSGIGLQFYFDFSDNKAIRNFTDAFVGVSSVPYSRMIAGAGGNSMGNAGGNGGSLINVAGSAAASSFAAVAGAGGHGLTRGGNGGSVMNAQIDAAGQDATSTSFFGVQLSDFQVLVVAGEGGDAFAGTARSNDPLAYGGKNPIGGNGGSIINFSQRVGGDVNVQLIAGNGGNLINSGSTTDLKAKVGKGGSIKDVDVAGRIGDAGDPGDEHVPIKAYNPLYDGNSSNDRMRDFVRDQLLGDPSSPLFILPMLDGTVGNVGIVVGAKGRVRDANQDGQLDPAPDISGSVPNGSLTNVRAQHIMSAVAGHVERIASIQVLSNVRVTIVGGEYGSDRDRDTDAGAAALVSNDGHAYVFGSTPGSFDYLTADGNWSATPVLGGRLVDGAIIAKTTRTPQSDRDFKIG